VKELIERLEALSQECLERALHATVEANVIDEEHCSSNEFGVDLTIEFNGFAGCLRELLREVMVRNRRATSVKLLVYDGRGFWLCQKRISAGRFRFWPAAEARAKKTRALEPHELGVLLAGGDPQAAQGAPPWRRVHANA